ncbi:MAG TPA: site-specific DNA-methyltransferase, partial [Candidatus Hydrogenedentes bacterium]|nr:site-specific DNA-methyltransferase [Candidatus Hydrogenedentota bacterium]
GEGNVLYHGNHLDVLPRYVKHHTVNVVSQDAPFDSDANYNMRSKEHDEALAVSQTKAHEETR